MGRNITQKRLNQSSTYGYGRCQKNKSLQRAQTNNSHTIDRTNTASCHFTVVKTNKMNH